MRLVLLFVDVCETFVVQMKDILSIHALRFSMNVDTEGLDSHRHRSQEVLTCRRLGARCCIEVVDFFCAFLEFVWVSLHFPSRCWVVFLKGEHGVWSTLSAESACKMFVLLGMVNHSAWFEGCFISQRFHCRIMAASDLSRKRLSCTRGNVISKGKC